MVKNSLFTSTAIILFSVWLPISVHAQLSEQLIITEIMWDSGSPGANEFGEGGHLNGDWWELTNVGSEPIDITGFMWDDDDRLVGNDFAIIPEFVIQPSEAIIFVREDETSVEHPDGFRTAWQIPAEMRILNESFITGFDSTTLDKRLTELRTMSTDQIASQLDGLGLSAEDRTTADTFLAEALEWSLADIRALDEVTLELSHENLITYEFFERVDFGGDSFSGISSGGDELNLYDAEGNQIQSIEVGPSTTGVSIAWGFEDGELTELGLSEVGEFEALATITDGTEGRLLRDDDFNILFDENGEALIDEEYIPEFADIGSPGRVFGFDVVFPELDSGEEAPTLASICAGVAAGSASADDLSAALTAAGVLPGDADQNGTVAFADFLTLSSNFGTSPSTDEMSSFQAGDFDCNGNVEFADFLILSANFGQSSAAEASAVPEANTNVLALVGALLLSVFTRRQRS